MSLKETEGRELSRNKNSTPTLARKTCHLYSTMGLKILVHPVEKSSCIFFKFFGKKNKNQTQQQLLCRLEGPHRKLTQHTVGKGNGIHVSLC